jgi:predicted CopG family antitoxin
MAVKTITITTEAYERLKRVKREGESFSEVIQRTFKPPLDVGKLVAGLSKLSDQTLDAVEEHVETRRRRPAKRRVA